MTSADEIVQKAAAALQNAEDRELLERNLQMSAVYELVDRTAIDLKQFRPERTAEIKTLSDYAAVIASHAGLSRALGQAQTGVKKSTTDVAKKFAATPAMATVLASAPVTIFLRWIGVLEAVGKSVGEQAAFLVVAIGLLSAGALVHGGRGLAQAWSSVSSSWANRPSTGTNIISLPSRVRANLAELDQTVEAFMKSVGRRRVEPPVYRRAQALMWGIVGAGVVSVAIALAAAYVGFSDGYDKACQARPDSRACVPQSP